jgi:hypothetical protein
MTSGNVSYSVLCLHLCALGLYLPLSDGLAVPHPQIPYNSCSKKNVAPDVKMQIVFILMVWCLNFSEHIGPSLRQ